MPDIIPLQKDEEFGGTSQAPIELGAQVAASGTALTQLGANWKSNGEAAVSACPCGRALHAPASSPTHRHHRQQGQGPRQPEGRGAAAPTHSLRLPVPLRPGVKAPCPMPTGTSAERGCEGRDGGSSEERDPEAATNSTQSPSTVFPPAPCLPVHQPCCPCWADTHEGHVPGWASVSSPCPLLELVVPPRGATGTLWDKRGPEPCGAGAKPSE